MISTCKYPKALYSSVNIALLLVASHLMLNNNTSIRTVPKSLLLVASHLMLNAQDMVYSDSLKFSAGLFKQKYDPLLHGRVKGAEISTTIRLVQKKIYRDSVIFEIPAVMNLDKSWIRTGFENSEDVLAHEKLHFSISELFARKLREKLQKGQYTLGIYEHLTYTMYRDTKVEWRLNQYRYDEETQHGADLEMQKKWEAAVLRDIEELKEYANPKITLPVFSADRN
jgi:hypothetical protein